MTSIPRVFPSGEVVARAAGTDVYLLTVETWGGHVVVRMAGALTDAISADLVARESAMQAWHERRLTGSDEWPPRTAGELIFDELRVQVTDDLGTEYALTAGSAGGSGTELLSEWTFTPAPPPAAGTLTITVTSADGSKSAHTVGPAG